MSKLQSHIQALDRGDSGSCRESIDSLKRYQTRDWDAVSAKELHALVSSLQKQLKSDATQPFLRREIALLLGSIGPRSEAAIPQLRELLHQSSPTAVREAAASALGRIGKKARGAINELIDLFATEQPLLITEAVRALGNIGCADERVSAALVNLWATAKSATLQLEVALALCKLRIEAPGVLRVLTHTLLTSREAAFRKSAALALAWCDKADPDVAPALLSAALKEKDEDVRQTAETSLRTLGLSHEKAVQLCARQLKDSTIAEATLKESGAGQPNRA